MESLRGLVRPSGVERVYDLTRGLALPGFIDIHTHLRGLELSYKEDEKTGTMAAARGGYTMVVDMPNTRPRVDNRDVLREKLERLERDSVVDYRVWVALPRDPGELIEMVSTPGVAGLKIYPEDMPRLEEFDKRALERVPRIVVHAEDPDAISEECERGYRWRCRPIDSEISAIERVYRVLGRRPGVDITHVTNTYTALVAKRYGYYTDTCPHYLYLDSGHEERLGCIAKVNPPLRPRPLREMLLEELGTGGLIDMLSTDHAPHSLEEKSRDFRECPPGISSIEFAGPLLLDLVNRGVLSIDRLVDLSSRRPAAYLGLERYGCIERGCVASYTVVDLGRETLVRSSDMVSRSRNTPYDGMRLRGYIYATVARGAPVYIDGVFTGERP